VQIKGALHVHSYLSHDGTLTVPELIEWYSRHGYQFVAIGEHSQDMDETKAQILIAQSAEHSSSRFCVIPGIEYACEGGLHIVGVGVVALIRDIEPVAVVDVIHQCGGFAILAHPKRDGWECAPQVVRAVDAAEIWNVAYDGKFLPSPQSLMGFPRMREINPRLLAVAGHDFHRKVGFYDVGIVMDVPALSTGAIIGNLQQGRFEIRAPFFCAKPQAQFSFLESARLRFLSWQLSKVKQARDLVLRLCS